MFVVFTAGACTVDAHKPYPDKVKAQNITTTAQQLLLSCPDPSDSDKPRITSPQQSRRSCSTLANNKASNNHPSTNNKLRGNSGANILTPANCNHKYFWESKNTTRHKPSLSLLLNSKGHTSRMQTYKQTNSAISGNKFSDPFPASFSYQPFYGLTTILTNLPGTQITFTTCSVPSSSLILSLFKAKTSNSALVACEGTTI